MVDKQKVCELIEQFTGVSGIGLICLDNILKRHPKSSSKWRDADLRLLDYTEVIRHLETLLMSSSDLGCSDLGCSFETFFTQSGFIYNIHLITHSHGHYCVLLTDPVLVQPLTEKMIRETGIRRKSSIDEQIHFREILLRVPVVSWQQASHLGVILQSMCCVADVDHAIHQTTCVTDKIYDQHQEMIHKTDFLLAHDKIKDVFHENRYRQIKYVIQTGDFEAMTRLLSSMNLTDFPVSQMSDIDILRTAKNSFTMTCMLACFNAIEAGYPYHDAFNLAHKLVNETEKMQDVNAVFANMKVSISAFTTAVSQYKDGIYSKTMHEVLLYIQSRYRERISLKEIAGHVGLHPNYLSSLVKKETGLPLFEHVKKIRVEMSKYELQHTTRTVAQIAQSVGFSHQNHYGRVFKRMTGMTPIEFRKEAEHREACEKL